MGRVTNLPWLAGQKYQMCFISSSLTNNFVIRKQLLSNDLSVDVYLSLSNYCPFPFLFFSKYFLSPLPFRLSEVMIFSLTYLIMNFLFSSFRHMTFPPLVLFNYLIFLDLKWDVVASGTWLTAHTASPLSSWIRLQFPHPTILCEATQIGVILSHLLHGRNTIFFFLLT